MDIGKRVRDAREARGITQEELARRAGVPLNRVGRIETGAVTDPHYSTLSRIAGGLDVSVGELLQEPVPLAEAPEAGPTNQQDPLPPSSPEPEGGSEEERRYLRALFGSWGHHINDQNEKWGPLLRDLPEDPTAEEYESGCKVIEEAFATYESILNAMARYGVLETLDRFVDDLQDDEPVPDEIRQEVIYLNNVFNPMIEYIFPRGRNWTTRADESYRMQTSLDAVAEKWAQRLGTQRT
jgi:transcriptional regulator with XRE-family HTH domain